MRRRIALILPSEGEFMHRLAEGAASYAVEHAGVEMVDLPYRSGEKPSGDWQVDFEGAVIWPPVLSRTSRALQRESGRALRLHRDRR